MIDQVIDELKSEGLTDEEIGDVISEWYADLLED